MLRAILLTGGEARDRCKELDERKTTGRRARANLPNNNGYLNFMSTTSVQAKPNQSHSMTSAAWKDIVDGLMKSELWGRLGWLDVKRRYQRTALGPFWNSATLTVYTIAVGAVGAGLFHQDFQQYLPYLVSGMIVWTLISMIILESCTLFVTGHALFRNVRFEYSILAYALVWRSFIFFIHNLIVYLVIALLLQPQLIGFAALLAIPGLFLVLLNGVWVALLFGMFCLRFRDVQPLVQTLIQIFTLVTPIFWSANNLVGLRRFIFVQLNPIYHLIEIVRAPLLGAVPSRTSFAAALAISAMGWCLAFLVFRFFRRRISYWS
jgi:ABC-type polysaccharide/polyol phosphate export permease